MEQAGPSVAKLLDAHREGDLEAFDDLVGLVYDGLRELARVQLRRNRPDGGLDTTALVHELYCKLVDSGSGWRSHGHFFAACALAMRHLLVDEARRQVSQQRGSGLRELTLEEGRAAADGDPELLLDLDRLLEQLAEHDSRLVRVFECRYFCGFSIAETARTLNISPRTVERDWTRARAWLRHALAETRGDGSG